MAAETAGAAASLTGQPMPVFAWSDGHVSSAVGEVPRARTALALEDRLGALKVRWNIGRTSYRVPPGLYAVGAPNDHAPVLVSANYKLSFDHLRRALSGMDAWILVLDTKGINVWCAAGKGTFGTDEIVRQVKACALEQVVSHRKIIVPQLGAPGVCAHEVQERCGFRVEYGPVRAEDLPAFLSAQLKATPEMRRIRFGVGERFVLIPVELVLGAKKALVIAAAFVLVGGLSVTGYSMASVRTHGLTSAALGLGAYLGACILGPLLLPWLPGRPFALKGVALGLLMVASVLVAGWPGPGLFGSWLHAVSWALMIPAIASFVLMNFTGASTFTSLSGVLREMRFAVPAQIATAALGVVLWVVGLFVAGGHS